MFGKIEELKQKISYKWRVQSFSKKKASASCVAYVDSRQVQDLLDLVVGPENWQDKYYECKGNLYCSIGIRINGGWVWKSDCGTESNVDKQKGESSDAFKRAAVKWGIGRFLYSLKIHYVPSSEKKTDNNWPYVVDPNGNQVWDLTKYINNGTTSTNGNSGSSQTQKPEDALKCPDEYLQLEYLDKNWGGQLYGKNIYFNNIKYFVNDEWAEYLKKHPKYKPSK